MYYIHEVFITKKHVSSKEWQQFVDLINSYCTMFKKWYLKVVPDKTKLRFYLKLNKKLPFTINNLDAFLIGDCEKEINFSEGNSFFPRFLNQRENMVCAIDYCEVNNKGLFDSVVIEYRKSLFLKNNYNIYLNLRKNNRIKQYKLPDIPLGDFLAMDAEKTSRFEYKSPPKYLDISKAMHILQSDPEGCILKVDTFPYLQGDFYVSQSNYSFNKHSIILGSSGCGKSKFIGSFIENIYKNPILKRNYRVVIIDPHASLEQDVGGLGRVVDFKTNQDSVDLFVNDSNDVVASTELLMELFKTLIASQYNSKLERVLRHSLYLLLVDEDFNFTNLRMLLLDLEYRNGLIKKLNNKLPTSVVNFFLADFNDLRTTSYGEAISPIIGFIDEMEMLPVFNNKTSDNNLKDIIQNNFLSIFSLDRTKLGDKVIKTIAGLVMQQLLTLIQKRCFNEHIIFIIDEVAVVENPILCRFLSEARKYNLSLILAGQYFNQITEELRSSIFSNVVNYYVFRISKLDAQILVDNFDIQVPLDNTRERKLKLLTEQNNRECIVRIATNDVLMPAFKARTMNFSAIPRVPSLAVDTKKAKQEDTEPVGVTLSMPPQTPPQTPLENTSFSTSEAFDFGDELTKPTSKEPSITNESFTFEDITFNIPEKNEQIQTPPTLYKPKVRKYAYMFDTNLKKKSEPTYNITNDSNFTFDVGTINMDDILKTTSSDRGE